jgi:hypothetical protein
VKEQQQKSILQQSNEKKLCILTENAIENAQSPVKKIISFKVLSVASINCLKDQRG